MHVVTDYLGGLHSKRVIPGAPEECHGENPPRRKKKRRSSSGGKGTCFRHLGNVSTDEVPLRNGGIVQYDMEIFEESLRESLVCKNS